MGLRCPPIPGNGEFLFRIRKAYQLLSPCKLCPRRCGVDRLAGKKGRCGVGLLPKVASTTVHQGEEPPITGTKGSGTIFFSGCNLKCIFCQNYPISQLGVGREITVGELAKYMLQLQNRGVHNINFVNPTHFVPQIIAAIYLARVNGLTIPIVYNSNGYENPEVLKLLAGVINVFLPDWKYAIRPLAKHLSSANNYPLHARRAFRVFRRIAGKLSLDQDSVARHGLIIRHLILPEQKRNSKRVARDIRKYLGSRTNLSIMGQYFPTFKAMNDPYFCQRCTPEESAYALIAFGRVGLYRGWRQVDGSEFA